MQVTGPDHGDEELSPDDRPGIEVVLQRTLAQGIEVDIAIRIAVEAETSSRIARSGTTACEPFASARNSE